MMCRISSGDIIQLAIVRIRNLAIWLGGEYQIFLVYEKQLKIRSNWSEDSSLDVVKEADHSLEGDEGAETYGFSIVKDGQILVKCRVRGGDGHESRNFWPLGAREGELVALETVPEARGRGLAPKLLELACSTLAEREFDHLYARIWHSNSSSIRAFRKAGWTRRALVIEVYPLGKKVRMVLGRGRWAILISASPDELS
jgi:ribosomal protein S18 acetylase RimI-like enzyme